MINNDVTVAICTKNAELHLEFCLQNLLKLQVKKIIAIDADSKDKTKKILNKYKIKIYKDHFKTLGGARSIAVNKAKTKYLLFVGPDNIIEKKTIQLLKKDMKKNGWVGIAPLQRVYKPKGYILKSLDTYKVAKITAGIKKVIGTPQLYLSNILKQNNYNSKMHYSDDTELGERLTRLNYKIGIENRISYEIGEDKLVDLFKRWQFYGLSDRDFYNLKKNKWSFRRKIISLFSPIKKDFLNIFFSKNIDLVKKIYILPFLFFIVFSRYLGWLK